MNSMKAVIEIQNQANTLILTYCEGMTAMEYNKIFYQAFGLIAAIRYLVPYADYQKIVSNFMSNSVNYVASLGGKVKNMELMEDKNNEND